MRDKAERVERVAMWVVMWVCACVAVACVGLALGNALTEGRSVVTAVFVINAVTWTILAINARTLARTRRLLDDLRGRDR